MYLYLIFQMLLLHLASKAVSTSCPTGWTAHGASCYHFSHDKETWASAMTICRAFEGHLAIVNDAAEGRFLSNQVKLISAATHTHSSHNHNRRSSYSNTEYWIDGEDLMVEGEWIWMDTKAPMNSSGYTNWGTGQPDNRLGNQNCLEIWASGYWGDEACSVTQNYICEKDQQQMQILG